MANRAIPNQQTNDRNLGFAQGGLQQALGPLLKNPLTNGIILEGVALTTGSNTISHGLGRNLQGWFTVRVRSSATFYDTQDTNTTPQNTLVLVASADVVVNLYVY